MYDDQLILPTDLQAYGGGGGPTFRTKVVETAGGVEYRDTLWSYERARYTVSFAAMLDSGTGRYVSWQEMLAFFRVAQGMGKSFRAKDPTDCTVSTSEGRFIATDSATSWQAVKRYTVGTSIQDKIITKPGAATVAGGLTIDQATGLVTNGSAPANWSTPLYYINVRFDTDEMVPKWFSRAGGGMVMGWEDIPLIEVRDE